MALAHSPRIVTDGLALCLDAGNTKSYSGSGTTWNDLSGNGNTGTLTNGPTYSSDNGGSIFFDGTNDYVSLVDNLGDPQQFTIEFWAYPTQLNFDSNNNYRRIFIPSPVLALTSGASDALIPTISSTSFFTLSGSACGKSILLITGKTSSPCSTAV